MTASKSECQSRSPRGGASRDPSIVSNPLFDKWNSVINSRRTRAAGGGRGRKGRAREPNFHRGVELAPFVAITPRRR